MDIRLAMTGFGNVGRSLAQLLAEHRGEYQTRYGVRLLLTGVADQGGARIDAGGLDERRLLADKGATGTVATVRTVGANFDAREFLNASRADVFIEAASTNFVDAEPGWSSVRAALALKMHVVFASKGVLVLYYPELLSLAREAGRSVAYSATVGAPLPILELTSRALLGTHVIGFEGMLNSTANVILEAMVQGKSYDEGVRAAQALGIAETDPTLDVDGWDAAAKAAIVANAAFGSSIGLSDVHRQGIREVSQDQLETARAAHATLRLLSTATAIGDTIRAEVRVEQRSANDPLGRLRGSELGIVLHTDQLGDFTASVENTGGITGGIPTALTVLRDVLNLTRAVR